MDEDEGFDDDGNDDDGDNDQGSGEDESEPTPKRAKRGSGKKLPALTKKVSSFGAVRSKLDIHAKDGQGLGVFHYLVNRTLASGNPDGPDSLGVWQSLELYDLLKKAGARPDPGLAAKSGQTEFARRLNAGRALEGWVRASSGKQPAVDVAADAAAFRAQDEEKRAQLYAEKKAEIEKAAGRPSRNSDYAETGDIVVCEETKVGFNVLLNKTDISYGQYGFYNFYRMQLIQRRGAELYIVFTNWGRIGDEGQWQRTPFRNKTDAIKEFRSVFRAKTGNDWTNIESFEEHPKKYHLVKRDLSEWEKAASIAELNLNLDCSLASQLPEPIQSVCRDLADVAALKANTRSVGVHKQILMPFGMLSKATLLQARDVLFQIADSIRDLEGTDNLDGKESHDKALRHRSSLADLSEQFYQLVPMRGMESCQLSVIDSAHSYGLFYSMIHNLIEFEVPTRLGSIQLAPHSFSLSLEVAGEVVCAAAFAKEQMAPTDYVFAALNGCFAQLHPTAPIAQHILHYIHNSAPDVVVDGIFSYFAA